ncbi:hypothetical protein TUM17387_26930 [Shewanella carassii]|nr:hypothetical protein [Shewanella carassii]BCV67334.1 hypothetical protein TUM17387_26930 [Shewanella carassii]
MMKSLSLLQFPRRHPQALTIISRALASILGGYLIASLACALLAVSLPMSRIDSTVSAMMLSFLIYALVVIRVFCVKRSLRAWQEILLLAVALFGTLKLLGV